MKAKKIKSCLGFYDWPKSIHACQQRPNPSRDSAHFSLKLPSPYSLPLWLISGILFTTWKSSFIAYIWQVHGPITKEFAVNKLAKLKFKKGSYLVRQSAETQGKVPKGRFCPHLKRVRPVAGKIFYFLILILGA